MNAQEMVVAKFWYFFLLCLSSSDIREHIINSNNIQPRLTPFPSWNQSVVPCPVLTVALYESIHRFRF